MRNRFPRHGIIPAEQGDWGLGITVHQTTYSPVHFYRRNFGLTLATKSTMCDEAYFLNATHKHS